jgi:hypothetical protein
LIEEPTPLVLFKPNRLDDDFIKNVLLSRVADEIKVENWRQPLSSSDIDGVSVFNPGHKRFSRDGQSELRIRLAVQINKRPVPL